MATQRRSRLNGTCAPSDELLRLMTKVARLYHGHGLAPAPRSRGLTAGMEPL